MKMIRMANNLDELRKYIFIELIKRGYKYIARDKEGTIYAFSFKPTKQGSVWYFNITSEDGGKLEDISLLSCIFTDIEWEDVEPFEIPYTNWKEVPVDTPIVYTSDNGRKYIQYFCTYEQGNTIMNRI